jgi:predicted Zn-dependent protease
LPASKNLNRNGHARRIPASKAAGSFKQTVVASSLFEDALALDPRSVEAQSRLASALSARVMIGIADPAAADIARAEALAGQALAAAPGSPFAHYAKGEVLRVQNRCDEAIFEFETVLAVNHNATGALFHLVQSRTDDAIVWLEKARSAVPEPPNVHALPASAYALQGGRTRCN